MYEEETTYINIQSWMVQKLKLKSNELIIYALIHGFCQDGKSFFYGSIKYIMTQTNLSKECVLTILQSLVNKKLIVKKEVKNITVFEKMKTAQGNQHFCLYYTRESRKKMQRTFDPSDPETPLFAVTGQENVPAPVKNVDPQSPESTVMGQENVPVPVKNVDPQSPENAVTGQENTPAPVKNVDPISYGYNKAAASYNITVTILNKLFGENAFDKSFYTKAAEFLIHKNIQPENYCQYICDVVIAKNPHRPKGLFHALFFEDDIVQDFLECEKQKKAEEEKVAQETVICPVCNNIFIPDYRNTCPQCKFDVAVLADTVQIELHKNYLQLSDADKAAYDQEKDAILIQNLHGYRNKNKDNEHEAKTDRLLKELAVRYKLIKTDKEVLQCQM